jgi:hypothetical protein
MLSSEGSNLARLILERHSLLCRAVELDLESEVEALRAVWECKDLTARNSALFQIYCERMPAKLLMLPIELAYTEEQIAEAWLRLRSVSPRR